MHVRWELFANPSIILFFFFTWNGKYSFCRMGQTETYHKSIPLTWWTQNILLRFHKTSGICSNVSQMPGASTLPIKKGWWPNCRDILLNYKARDAMKTVFHLCWRAWPRLETEQLLPGKLEINLKKPRNCLNQKPYAISKRKVRNIILLFLWNSEINVS